MLNLDPWIAEALERLDQEPTALAYLRSRNILSTVVKKYNIGFVKKFHSISADSEEADKWNQTFCSGKFISTNKLIFPHHDDNGKVMSFSTRSLGSKYYSHFIPEYASFKGALWGWSPSLESIWSTRHVIITEGIFDLLSLAHFRNDVLCTLTRTLTDGQFRRINRFVDKVTLAFDMDDPGRKGCEYWAKKFEEAGKSVQVLEYPHKDLNEWWVADPKNMIVKLRL
jgi:DNA primase